MPSKTLEKTYYFTTDTFIDIVHDIERIPERAPPRTDFVTQAITTAQLDRWRELFGLDHDESRIIIADVRADADTRCEPSEELDCVEDCEITNPKDVGTLMAHATGEWELYVKDAVDNYISRIGCAPGIKREKIYLHPMTDDENQNASMIALRTWEAALLRTSVPPTMRSKGCVFYTGSWESLSLAWAPKVIRGPDARKDKYPVWYFLTGPIARPDKLQALWKLDKRPIKRHAYVTGLTTINHINRVATRRSQNTDIKGYTKRCPGLAYLVKDELAEKRLRYFKTDHFNVVNCDITLQPLYKHGQRQTVKGLTFVLTEWALKTMDVLYFTAAARSCMAQYERRTGNLEYVMSKDATSMEPSLAFEGSLTLGEDEVLLRERHPEDEKIMVYEFPRVKQGRREDPKTHRSRVATIRKHKPATKLKNVTNASELPENDSASGSSKAKRHLSWADLVTPESLAFWDQPIGMNLSSYPVGESNRRDEDCTSEHIEVVGSEEASDKEDVVTETTRSDSAIETVESNANKPTPIITTVSPSNANTIDEVMSAELGELETGPSNACRVDEVPMGEGNLTLAAVDAGDSSSTLTNDSQSSSSTLVHSDRYEPQGLWEEIFFAFADYVTSFIFRQMARGLDATVAGVVDLSEFEDDGEDE